MYSWTWEPSVLIGLALQAGAYLACVGPLRGRFAGSAPVPQTQIQTFLMGVLVLFIALVSPLDALGDHYLLAAHMIQHLLLTLIAPPLLLIGTPRRLLRPLLRLPFALPIGRVLTGPLVAFIASTSPSRSGTCRPTTSGHCTTRQFTSLSTSRFL